MVGARSCAGYIWRCAQWPRLTLQDLNCLRRPSFCAAGCTSQLILVPAGKPWVLDPVAAGISKFRLQVAMLSCSKAANFVSLLATHSFRAVTQLCNSFILHHDQKGLRLKP